MVETAGPGKFGDGNNLYLKVEEKLNKHWLFIFKWDGKQVEIGGGKAIGRDGSGKSGVTLAQARRWAKEGRGLLNSKPKIDPRTIWSPTPAPAAQTFGEAAASYIALKAPGWSRDHLRQWRGSLARYCSKINNLPIDRIDTAAVRAVLEPIWNKVPETAARVRNRIEIVINYARPDDDLRPNPARWRGHLDSKGFGKPKELGKRARAGAGAERALIPRDHFAALPFAAAPDFVRRLREEDSVVARALEFLSLTAARTGEVRGAQWSEINLIDFVWVIPPERLKAGKRSRASHVVPLVGRAIEIVAEMKAIGCDPYVFYGRAIDKPLSDSALLNLVKQLEPDATAHGFRSTFADFFGEETNFSSELVEHQLGHILGGVRGKYRRETGLGQRRTVLGLWDAYLAGAPLDAFAAYLVKPLATEGADNVVPFVRASYDAADQRRNAGTMDRPHEGGARNQPGRLHRSRDRSAGANDGRFGRVRPARHQLYAQRRRWSDRDAQRRQCVRQGARPGDRDADQVGVRSRRNHASGSARIVGPKGLSTRADAQGVGGKDQHHAAPNRTSPEDMRGAKIVAGQEQAKSDN
jgi:integrase